MTKQEHISKIAQNFETILEYHYKETDIPLRIFDLAIEGALLARGLGDDQRN